MKLKIIHPKHNKDHSQQQTFKMDTQTCTITFQINLQEITMDTLKAIDTFITTLMEMEAHTATDTNTNTPEIREKLEQEMHSMINKYRQFTPTRTPNTAGA